jgi:putative peptidoglycan binding protein
VVARHGGNWHRNWDRRRDHFWHGRRCHWHNNAWVIFDTGFFFPYSYGYGYYPYNAYAYDDGSYYDDGYASNEYSQQSYQPQSDYDSGNADSNISEIQSALSREGYYSGAVDGSLGPGTRSALRRYQRDHGLAVTGRIDRAVINALGLR